MLFVITLKLRLSDTFIHLSSILIFYVGQSNTLKRIKDKI
jgi:hypothetical protein